MGRPWLADTGTPYSFPEMSNVIVKDWQFGAVVRLMIATCDELSHSVLELTEDDECEDEEATLDES